MLITLLSSITEHEVLKDYLVSHLLYQTTTRYHKRYHRKEIVSDKFCVGGYKFDNVGVYKRTYEKLRDKNVKEIFVSYYTSCLMNKQIF